MTLRLSEVEAPLDDVEFPNGAVRRAVPFDAESFALQNAINTLPPEATEERAAKGLDLLRRCVPEASDEDLSTLSQTMVQAIILHCRRQLDMVLATLEKNGGAGAREAAARTQPSSPSTTKHTSSRASSKRSGATGSTATVAATP